MVTEWMWSTFDAATWVANDPLPCYVCGYRSFDGLLAHRMIHDEFKERLICPDCAGRLLKALLKKPAAEERLRPPSFLTIDNGGIS